MLANNAWTHFFWSLVALSDFGSENAPTVSPGEPTALSQHNVASPRGELETVAHAPSDRTGSLRVRCPHCQNPIELASEAGLSSIDCPSCNNQFSIAGDSASHDDETQPTHFGHFELLERLGVGAFGTVWKAHDAQLERIVALKIPRKGQLDNQEAESFLREARAAAQLKHPNIVGVHEIGRENDRVYIVSDFVAGGSLAERLQGGPLTSREAAELCAKLAAALQHAHERGVIHRDLKPANILLDRHDQPQIADFGLAKRDAGDVTMTIEGQVMGTPAYMSPEQATGKGHQAGPRSDVYSLGVILFELLTGEVPFRGSIRMLLKQVVEDIPPGPRKLNSNVPKDLETICGKCLEKLPGRRYETAGHLAADLTRFLNNEPIEARPIGNVERAWRWRQRKPMVAALAATVAGLLLLVGVSGPLVALREAALRETAEQNEAKAEQLAEDEVAAREEAEAATELEKLARREAVAAKNALAAEKERSDQTLYARTISLAYQQWQDDNVHRAEDLIDKADHQFREWEWHFVKKLCNSEHQTLRGHAGMPAHMRFSPDGNRLVSIGKGVGDANIYVWDLAAGAISRRFPFRGFAISPDASRVAVEKAADGPVSIIDVSTRDEVVNIPAPQRGIELVGFNSDGSRVATAGHDQAIRIWDAATGEELQEIEFSADSDGDIIFSDLVFSPDDRYLVWKAWRQRTDVVIRILDVEAGEVVREIADPLYRLDALQVRISPNSKVIASASNGPIHLFDIETGETVETLHGHRSSVFGLAFSPDGRRLVSSGIDQTVRVWDVAEGREMYRFRGHKAGLIYGVLDVAYSSDGQWIASGGADTTIKIWPADAGDGYPREDVLKLRDAPKSDRVAFMLPDPDQERDWLIGNAHYVADVDFSTDGRWIATASEDEMVRLFDAETRQLVYTFDKHKENVAAVAFHPEGDLIASAGGGINDRRAGTVLIWDRKTGKIQQTLRGHAGPVSAVRFSSDGSRIYSSSGSQGVPHRGEVIGWDVNSGEQVFKNDGLKGVRDMDLSPDGKLLAAATYGARLTLLDATNGKKLRDIGAAGKILYAVAFSPDGKHVATGSSTWAVEVLDVRTGDRIWEQIEHSGAVTGLAFDPSGARIVSASVDRTAKMWNAASGDMVIDLKGDAFELFDVAISANGNTIATFGEAPYVTLRSISKSRSAEPGDADQQWPVIFADDFERDELGDQWSTPHGPWEIQDGAAKGTLANVPSVPGYIAATLVPKAWMPSTVEVEFDAWAPAPLVFQSTLQDEAVQNYVSSLYIGQPVPVFNQGRLGGAVFMQTAGSAKEVARVPRDRWFEPDRKYRLRIVRNRDRWEMFIDGQPILETKVSASMWAPVLNVAASFGQKGAEVFIDNIVVRAPKNTADEVAATDLEFVLRQELKLKSLVVAAIDANTEISDGVRKLALRFANLRKEDKETRLEIIRDEVLRNDREEATYRAFAAALSKDADDAQSDWETRQVLAAAHFRAGDFEAALDALDAANATYQREAGSLHPVQTAIRAITHAALDQSNDAQQAMDQLRELMRSDHWKKNDDAVAWQQEARKAVSVAESEDPELAAEIEAIRDLTFEPQQRSLVDAENDAYFASFSDDAVQIDGRSATPNEYDVETNIADWKEAQRVFFHGIPLLHTRLTRHRADVNVQGDEAALSGAYTFWIPFGYWRWVSDERLRKTPDGWKIHRRRFGITEIKWGNGVYHVSDDSWHEADQAVDEAREAGETQQLVLALLRALRRQEAFEVSKRMVEKPNAPAETWAALADRAYGVSSAEEMLRAGREAVRLNPNVSGGPFLRALAVEQNLRDDPTNFGHGVAARVPKFFPNASTRDFQGVPGEILRAWYPNDHCALIVFFGENILAEATVKESAAEALESFTKALNVQTHKTRELRVDGLEASSFVMEGHGNGRTISRSATSREGTVQNWVLVQRGDDLIGFLLTAASEQFDDRNSEFLTWLKHVEFDTTTGALTQKLRGLSADSLERVADAVELATTIDPDDVQTNFGKLLMGEALILAEKPEQSAEVIRQAIDDGAEEHWYQKSLGWAQAAAGQKDDAVNAFRAGLADLGEFNADHNQADPDHWICAYFLDMVTAEQFAERWRDDKQRGSTYACFAWFYIGQRHEIEGRTDDAIKAYENSVRLGKLPGAFHVHHWAAHRLQKLRSQ